MMLRSTTRIDEKEQSNKLDRGRELATSSRSTLRMTQLCVSCGPAQEAHLCESSHKWACERIGISSGGLARILAGF